ncbi:MAG: endonuclease/exonuclease/phosphatase family protein [Ilumatobacteraceae bacterium]
MAATVAGALVLVPCAATLILRQVAVDSRWPVAYVAASPYVIVAAVVALGFFLLARAWLGAAVALVAGLVLATSQLPLYVADAAPAAADGTTTVVMTLNLYFGQADAAAVVGEVRARQVDLLMLQELTDEAREELRAAGLDRELPHAVTSPIPGASGNGLWSRTPIDALVPPDGFGHPPVAGTIELAGQQVLVADVHPVAPYPFAADQWSAELRRLADWLGTGEGPAVVAGDLNATFDHRQFRDLLDTGLRDAVEQAGAGYVPTYPVGRRFPPLISIDHILTRGPITATDVETQELPGTDHRALLATLVVAPA